MKIITITAGHSNVDSGAVAKDGTKEADLTVKFRNAVVTYLQKYPDVHVRVDGYGTTNLPLADAIKLIKGSDVAVECHMNASANATAGGTETIALPKDKVLAQQLSAAVSGVFGNKIRGDKGYIDQTQTARGRLGYINAGGLILELSFISNETELKVFNDRYWQAAKAVAEVLLKHIGVIK